MFKTSLYISIFFCLLIIGCAAKNNHDSPHTHIWFGDWKINIWSYKKVDYVTHKSGIVTQMKGHAEYQLKKGDQVHLENGPIIKQFDDAIYIGSQPIPDNIINPQNYLVF